MKPRTTFLKYVLLIALVISPVAHSKAKLDVMAGYFSLQAKTKEKTGNVDNFGSYQLNFRYAVTHFMEVSIGYSLIASKTFSGDFGFGPDIGLVYFPFTSANPIAASSENVHFTSYETYKPYISGAFHQRQYQSIQSSYAGFGFAAGSEIYWKNNMSFKAEIRYLPLGGPDGAISNELDVLGGITFTF
jgi:opacity protein-like surface antigen